MRFDEFVHDRGVAVAPVDGFDDFVVQVGLPPDWEPADSAAGMQLWICRDDPAVGQFCANAVLTMHRVDEPLDPADVFAMLVEQQLQSLPGSREIHRDLAPSADGAGVLGLLALKVTHDDLGTLESVSRTRIITADRETLIAQLTVSALHDSPAIRAPVWLTVRASAPADFAPPAHPAAVQPTATPRDR